MHTVRTRLTGVLVALAVAITMVAASTPAVAAPQVDLVSLDNSGTAIEPVVSLDLSADGRVLLLASTEALVPGKAQPAVWNLYRRDLVTGNVELVSATTDGGYSTQSIWIWQAELSADGRFVAFSSSAADLASGQDNNGTDDVFVRDMASGTTTRVSSTMSGSAGNGSSKHASISGDGRYVAFSSDATDLVDGDDNGQGDIVVVELASGIATIASVDSSGKQADEPSVFPSLDYDGSVIAFQSGATNLSSVPANVWPDVFVRDLDTGQTEQLTTDLAGGPTNGASYRPDLSDDGNIVAFDSLASDLVANDTNNRSDVFVIDRSAGTVERVSVRSNGAQGNNDSYLGGISGDGKTVAFDSHATNLVWGDTNGTGDAFLHRLVGGVTQRLSQGPGGWNPNEWSGLADVDHDGTTAVFDSRADNILPGPSPSYGTYRVQS